MNLAYQKQLEKWHSRRTQIREMRQTGMTLAAIGKKYGITRQRVEQLLRNQQR